MVSPSNEFSSVAFILLTHFLSNSIRREYKKIQGATERLGTPWFVFQGSMPQSPRNKKIENVCTISRANMVALDYPTLNPGIIPGSATFPLLYFYENHPEYSHYWLIEYDVRFSGSWRSFFNDFMSADADFITAHIRSYIDEPDWERWELTHPHQSIPLEERLRSFNPIFRISNPALKFISSAYREEWSGHYEVLLPTLLHRFGFSLLDFGGTGSFVSPGMKNKYYTDALPNRKGFLDTGSLRFRPAYASPGPERNKLYHPIKPTAFRWRLQIRSSLDKLFGKQVVGKIVSILKSLPARMHFDKYNT